MAEQGAISRESRGQSVPESPAFGLMPPQISLPKGGGAVRSIGETFSANPVTGTGAMTVPVALSAGRSGFGPQLTLSYDSGAGNGPFGLGWALSSASIRRKTDRGVPTYDDEADTFQLSGAEDLVPELEAKSPGGELQRVRRENVGWARKRYTVFRYRPRIEGLFARIERWVQAGDPASSFWRTVSRDNITTWYGRDAGSRICDPEDPRRVFEWLICLTHDDKGNAASYEYASDSPIRLNLASPWETHRPAAARAANRYLKRIRYGNVTPFLPVMRTDRADRTPAKWLFEAVLDYGDHAERNPRRQRLAAPPRSHWLDRPDAFSTHRAGFEVRTYRLCRRVLMFHHFDGEPGVGRNCLVRSTEFAYDVPQQLDAAEQGGYSTLRAVTHRSFQRKPGSANEYESRALPPVGFRYSTPRVDPTVHVVDPGQLVNLPVGTQGPGYRWLDLDGEGLSGVLSEERGAWYYKPNLGDGRFGATRTVAQVPAGALAGASHQFMDLAGNGSVDLVDFGGPSPGFHARARDGSWRCHVPFAALPNLDWQDTSLRFIDLTGDGHADILIAEEGAFTWYPSLAARGFDAARRQRLPVDEAPGPAPVFADAMQTLFLADMCGDGLTDLVRIRNGEVCYWPNQGHGRFGRKVTLGNVPRFDAPDLFDPERIRLTDIDGSGPVDIIYLGRGGAQLYFNRSGNSLSSAFIVPLPVATENLSSVQVADLLGNGTACLVWNSQLPADAGRPVCYIDLMAGLRADAAAAQARRHHEKPHLLIHVDNHRGATTEIAYTPSTRFYLQDQHAGTPWATRLPFPVHCVSRVTVRDAWRKTTFSSTYTYHHGYFDGEEREFRGFGRVEQVDAQAFSDAAVANAGSGFFTQDHTLFQAPVKTTTWYHTGVALDRSRLLGLFASEYATARHAAAFAADRFVEPSLADPGIDPGPGPALTAGEWREAMRACKGMPLRQEVVELDARALEQSGEHREVRLFSATQNGCHLRRVQPRGSQRNAVFLAVEGERWTCHYELDLTASPLRIDPRINHTLNLRFDDWGNVLQSVAAVYPRRTRFDDPRLAGEQVERIRDVQAERHLAYIESRFTAPLADTAVHHRAPMPCEVRTYVLTGDDPDAGFVPARGPYFTRTDFLAFRLSDAFPDQGARAVASIAYHEQPPGPGACKRLIEHVRTLYWDDGGAPAAPSRALAFGMHGARGLKYEDYKLALTDGLLRAVFGTGTAAANGEADKLAWEAIPAGNGQPSRTCRELLRTPSISGYVPGDSPGLGGTADQYWMRSGTLGFEADAPLRFFLPARYVDAFGNTTTMTYDAHDLFVQSSRDALGNTVAVERFDYRVLAPARLRDANRSCSEVAFDVHGLPVASALLGRITRSSGGAEVSETGDTLANLGFADLNPAPQAVGRFFTSPDFDADQAHAWLGHATARFVYHWGEQRGADGSVLRWGSTAAGACSLLRESHRGVPTSPGPVATRDRMQVSFEYSDGAGLAFVRKVQAESEAAGGALRWLTNGKTIVNNKGSPVLQFEPFFSPGGHRFEEPQAAGVSPVMHYDAPGRLVRTDMPDGTFSRVEFSPWFSRSHDASDTVLDSRWYRARGSPDPLTPLRRDLSGRLLDGEEFRAAWLAARHADTPTERHFDSLGREVVTLTHNRVPGPASGSTVEWSIADRAWQDEFGLTFTRLDAEGKPLWVRDGRGNLVMQYITPPKPTRRVDAPDEAVPVGSVSCYDLAGNLLHQHSMDGGARWMLMDAAGKPLLAWDFNDRGPGSALQLRLYRTDHDALRRPAAQWLALDGGAPMLIEAFEYCDAGMPRDGSGPLSLDQAQGRRLIGQAVKHVDPSGAATVERVGLQGQPSHVTRRLSRPAAGSGSDRVDWSAASHETLLDPETFHQIIEYDALGRVTRLYNWHRHLTFSDDGTVQATPGRTNRVAVHERGYNQRGMLLSERIHVRARMHTASDGAVGFTADTTAPGRSPEAIRRITYDARGQKRTLELGNGTISACTHDEASHRLLRLQAHRPDGTVLLDLHYTHDPVGNVTHVRDDAQQTVYFDNARVEPAWRYTFDALYRLVEATGREHDVQEPPPMREGPWRTGSIPSNDQLRAYIQRFDHDLVGNLLQMTHSAPAGGWTRHHAIQSDSNRLHQTWMGSDAAQAVTYRHDAHGNMLNLHRLDTDAPSGSQIQWDWRDMIRTVDLGGGGVASYQYGIDRQRSRKHVTRNPQGGGTFEEDRIYLGGYELYRRRNAQGATVEEIESLHVFEGGQRVLLVDDVIATDNARTDLLPVVARTLFRYQHANPLGSVGLELDDAARIISYEEFHPCGTSAFRLMDAARLAPAKRYRYTGVERDEESGLSYHLNRFYSPVLVRWTSVDPAYLEAGVNVYQYVLASPTTHSDVTGLKARKAVDGPAPVDRTEPAVPEGWSPPDRDAPASYPLSHADFSFRFRLMDGKMLFNSQAAGLKPVYFPLIEIKKDRDLGTGRIVLGQWAADTEVVYNNGMSLETAEGVFVMQEGQWYPAQMWAELSAARSSLGTDAPTRGPSLDEWFRADALFGARDRPDLKAGSGFGLPDALTDSAGQVGNAWSKAWSLALGQAGGDSAHYVGPLLGPMGLGPELNPTGNLTDDTARLRSRDALDVVAPGRGAGLGLLEPGTAVGYSYLAASASRRVGFFAGVAPSSSVVPYFSGGLSQPAIPVLGAFGIGPSPQAGGFFVGARLSFGF